LFWLVLFDRVKKAKIFLIFKYLNFKSQSVFKNIIEFRHCLKIKNLKLKITAVDLLKQTKELCRIYEIKPARSKGQNFLIKENIYDDMVEAANLTKDDTVLEVGPGLGFLTAKLAKKAGKVIAVELDDKLAEVLRIGLDSGGVENVEVVNEDILKLQITNYKLQIKSNPPSSPTPYHLSLIPGYKVVANLPYNITSIFLRKVLEQENKPSMMVLMLQREVAERITAKPGEMSLLAISVQLYADVKIIKNVKREDFWPQPEVESAIIQLSIINYQLSINEREFFRLVKIGFSARRKMLKNNLANGYHLDQGEVEKRIIKAGLGPKSRAQDLSVDDWKKLLALFI
jgi:16S rRNA (adenine1518-N6/adenine1519-N6)-dimethyltransferase